MKNCALQYPGVTIQHSTEKPLSQMLLDGEIDALISARNPSCFAPGTEVVRLFPDHVATEKAWYARTGIHPIMHTVGVRRRSYQRQPMAGASLMKAFSQARAVCLGRDRRHRRRRNGDAALDDRLRGRDPQPHGQRFLAIWLCAQRVWHSEPRRDGPMSRA